MTTWLSTAEGLILEGVVIGLAGIAAVRIGAALLPGCDDPLERVAVSGMIGVAGWILVLEALGLLGILWLPVVMAVLLVTAAVSLRLLPHPERVRWRAPRLPAGLAVIALLFAALAVVEVLSVQPTLYGSDSVHYHIVNAAQILDSGSLRSLPFAQPGDGSAASPGNGSLLLLSTMLGLHTAALTGFVNLGCAALLVFMGGMLTREMGRGGLVGVAAALVVITTWCFFGTQVRTTYDDGIALLGLVSALAFGARSARTHQLRWLVMAGLGVGLAIGTKGVEILPGLLVAVAVVIIDRSWRTPRRAAAFVAAILSLSAVWYARNWAATGNPLFPEAVHLGPLSLTGMAASPAAVHGSQSLLSALLAGADRSVTEWLSFGFVSLGLALIALVVAPLVASLSRGVTRILSLLALGCIAAYMVTPFTSQVSGSLRYLLPAVVFSALSLASLLPKARAILFAEVALLVNGVLLLVPTLETHGETALQALAATAGITACVLALVLARRWRPVAAVTRHRSLRAAVGAGAAVLALAATLNLQPSTAPTPVSRALARAPDPAGPVVVIDVDDVTALLGPQLNVVIASVGDGPLGAQSAIRDPVQLTRAIKALHPAAVVIGNDRALGDIPTGWAPPPTWHTLGTQAGSVVYLP